MDPSQTRTAQGRTEAPDLAAAAEATAVASLASRVPEGGTRDADEILDIFLGWVMEIGFELYPAQEEALLEIMAGRHVILNTPTGSGKSLVALGMHFKALCEGKGCFYTSPIKALASEKFFDLCDVLGPENVGMQTGDASINADAAVVCATAEVLANRALRQGSNCGADYVVMDEFHYYGDPDRGTSWQIPLVTLPGSTFLLMSATLGNTAPISERLERFTGRKVSLVYSDERPVPLDFEYRETPLHETVTYLLEAGKAPIYIVNFTQRECAELAQSLTSVNPCTREERKTIRETIGDFRYDTPYGREIRRFLGFGVGVHHAGLLPKYRLLVEQLAQQGLLKVICGTDTLGVGVNIPIRTVLFTKLSKYDGEKVAILKVRDFKQISGRAGRKGYDDRGSVVCQAPEHVIETRKETRKKGKKKAAKKRPPPGFVSWNKQTFESLIKRPPETLKSRFRITHGMLLNLLQRDAELNLAERDNFDSLREVIQRSHEDDRRKRRWLAHSALLVRSLHRAGIIKMQRDTQTSYYWAIPNEELQWDFSLFQALSLYLVEALDVLDSDDPDYALDVISLVEAILETPRAVIYRQEDRIKTDLINRLKAEGVPYEERMNRLEEVSYPRPENIDFIEGTFEAFRKAHPWVQGQDIRPKNIGREIYAEYYSFNHYVRHYGLQRSEGVLLRYLSQLYKTLAQTVPERSRTEAVYDALGFFRTMLEHTDTSLIEEWESLLNPELQRDEAAQEEARRELRIYELFHDPKAFRARVRAELHQLVRCLAEGEYEEASAAVWAGAGDDDRWTAERLEGAMGAYLAEHGELVFNHEARKSRHTRVSSTGTRTWEFSQVLVDPSGENLWYLAGDIDLRDEQSVLGPLLRLRYLGT